MDLLEIQLSDDEEQIYAPLKRKWLKNTPEEAVRQEYIRCLVNDYGYTLDQMEQEYQSAIPGRGTGGAFADIVVWAKSNDKNNRKDALIVVECKAPSVTLSKKECGQLINYASDLNAKFLILTNRKETLFFKLKEGVRPAQIGDLIKINDIPNAQQAKQYSGKTFSFSVPIGLLPRDKEADNLFNCVIANSFFNLVGVGGSGKSSLASLMIQKHEEDFNEIAYVVVNNNIKNDFVEQINKTLNLEFERNEDAFPEIIANLQNNFKSEQPNLLVLDINETSDKTKNDEIINTIIKTKDILNGWKILILSREKVDTRNRIDTHNLNDNENVEFLKELFLQKAGERYNDFGDFAELFKIVFYNPLLTEQLALYLHNDPEPATIEDIKKILYGASFKEEDMQGLSADRHDETIVSFLTNLIKYNDFNDNEKNLLRHFVLWQAEYIGYEVIKDLLKGVFASDDDLKNTLKSLSKRAILDTNNNQTLGYKLHGLLAESLREQIDVTKQDYETYFNNIISIWGYNFQSFMLYADCIGNSLSEYEITTNVALLGNMAIKIENLYKTDYAKKLYDKCIEITNQKLEIEPENINYLKDLSYTYNHLGNLHKTHFNNYESAEKNYNNAIEIDKKIITISDIPKYLNILARHYCNLANLQQHFLNDTKSAEINYNKAIEILTKITKNSKHSEYLKEMAGAYAQIYLFHTIEPNSKEAETITRILEKTEYLSSLIAIYTDIADLQATSKRDYKSAEKNLNEAIRIGKIICFIDEKNDYLDSLAIAYNNLADFQKEQKRDYKSAQQNYEQAIKILDRIKDTDLHYLVDWIGVNYSLAVLYTTTKCPTKAYIIIDEIKSIAEKLLEEHPKYVFLKKVFKEIKDTESKLNQLSLP